MSCIVWLTHRSPHGEQRPSGRGIVDLLVPLLIGLPAADFVAASMAAMDDARNQNIPLEYYNIVYDAIESVESRMQEVLSPTPAGEYTGSATVQEVFNIGGTGNIAGSRCEDGILKKGANVRVMRGDKILIESTIKTLRNFKSETDSIEAGNECGIGLTTFEEFKADDVIECYVE